jgi:hypothetical protein
MIVEERSEFLVYSDISHLTLALLHQKAALVPLYPPFRRTRPTNSALVHSGLSAPQPPNALLHLVVVGVIRGLHNSATR